MKRVLIKAAVCLAVFLTVLLVSSNIYNQGNADMTTTMGSASLPLVQLKSQTISFNSLHGLKKEMDTSFLRDTITPLGEGRTLSFVIQKYGNEIRNLSFEVRSIDGSRLVESTQITEYRETDSQISATVTMKDLIEQGTEYNWILLVTLPNEETIRYYTRIIDAQEYHLQEKLEFVQDFHQKTFDEEEAKELVSYLESNSRGDNTTLSKVDIHCSLSQVTWGGLEVEVVTQPDIVIQEIEEQTASIRLNYIAAVEEGSRQNRYTVSEYYRIRYTQDRIYLLDYERTMEQIFDPEADVYASNKIMLGIRDDEVEMMESDGGSNFAFVNGKQLFCYHATDGKLAYLFGFLEDSEGTPDARSIYNHHDIKILNVDETGNVIFMVYGYMNRGSHEGDMGVLIYEYNGMLNTIEEQIFLPYDKAYATLKADVEQLSFVNKSSVCYLYLDGSILAIDLLELNAAEIATQLQEGSFQVSDSDEMLVWQNSADAYDCTRLILMNLNTGVRKEISTTGDSRMLPLGFINEDLIYGVAKYSDIVVDSTGAITFPMYVVYIQNEEGDILKSYEPSGAYVVGSSIVDNLITLKRVQKNEDGSSYTAIADDQIVNKITEDSGYNTSESVVTQKYERITQLVLKGDIDTKSLRITQPREVLFEGDRMLTIEIEEEIDRFYVYGKDGIEGTFTHPADAINLAYEVRGTVVNENGYYIWKRTTRSTRNQIMAIQGQQSDENTSDLAVCLETILDFTGYAKNVQDLLDQGRTVKEVLEESLDDAVVLELGGASLDAVLYYVNQDIPVLATLENDSAVLIIGFNELNIVVMNPQTGTVYKMGMNDSTEWFETNGNQFVTYIMF